MTTQVTFMAAIQDWIILVAGFSNQNVFQAQQNGPDRGPGTNWATYQKINGMASDYHMEKTEDADPGGPNEGEVISTTRVRASTSTISVNIYAMDGDDILNGLLDSKTERATRKLFSDVGACLISKSNNRPLFKKSDTLFKPRYQADFTFNTFSQRVETDFNANEFDIKGKIETDEVQIYVDCNG